MLGDQVTNQRHIIEYGLQGRSPDAIKGKNQVEDLAYWLGRIPNKSYRLVSVLFINGDFILIWEYKNENKGK